MTKEERKEIIRKISRRVLQCLEPMDDYSKLVYMEKLVSQIDEAYLLALDFAFSMTPEQPTQEGNNQ